MAPGLEVRSRCPQQHRAYGMWLFEMFTATIPFKGISPAEIPYRVANGERPEFIEDSGGGGSEAREPD